LTNTRYIGNVTGGDESIDRISARVGYKVAGLWAGDDGKVKLVSPHYFTDKFELSDDSKCANGHKKFGECSCGFYAYNDVTRAVRHWRSECGGYANFAVLQVGLSGSVVVAENGYRATHQRVKKILMPRCWSCDQAGTQFVYHENKFLVAGCDKHAKGVRTLSFTDFAEQNSPEGFKPIEVLSAKSLSLEAEQFLAPEIMQERAVAIIDDLLRYNRIDLVDEIIRQANNRLGQSLGL